MLVGNSSTLPWYSLEITISKISCRVSLNWHCDVMKTLISNKIYGFYTWFLTFEALLIKID